MFKTMVDFQVVSATDTMVTLKVAGIGADVKLSVLRYENGTLVNVPWVWHKELGNPGYEALKAILRPHYQRIETRTETDPRFKRAAAARSESTRARGAYAA